MRSSVQVINFNSGQVGFGQNEFTKRVGFSVAMPSANISFYINNTQESDSGLYICIVIIPGAPAISGQIRLNVKGNAEKRPATAFTRFSRAAALSSVSVRNRKLKSAAASQLPRSPRSSD